MFKNFKLFLLSLLVLPCTLLAGCGEHEHNLSLVGSIDATCETSGNTQYYTCECGKYFSDENATEEIVEDSWIVPATGHDYVETEYFDNDHEFVKKSVCSHNNTHVVENDTVELNSTNLNAVINDADITDRNWSDYKISLASGNYDKFTLNKANYIDGDGATTSDAKIYNRTIGELSFTGKNVETTTMNGFGFSSGLSVKYVNANGSGGLDYYIYSTYSIDTLKFTNITFTDKIYINSLLETEYHDNATISINNIIFDNCVFNFENNTTAANGAIHIISEDQAIANVTIKNCEFKNIESKSTINGILIDSRTEDAINIVIENNTFTDIAYNAIQISGSNSCYVGDVYIRDNNITNTGDRAIRISKLGTTANVIITGNVMVNASDADGELCKATVLDGAYVMIENNYWGSRQGTTPLQGMNNATSGANDIMDSNPKQSAN